jgi:hypothetical protein
MPSWPLVLKSLPLRDEAGGLGVLHTHIYEDTHFEQTKLIDTTRFRWERLRQGRAVKQGMNLLHFCANKTDTCNKILVVTLFDEDEP